MMLTKRKHFKNGVAGDSMSSNQRNTMDWMRINAEKERIQRYKLIVNDSGQLYYNVIERYAKLLEQRKTENKQCVAGQEVDNLFIKQVLKNYTHRPETQETCFTDIMEQNRIEAQLYKTLQFIGEFMRQVIEAGIQFN